MQLLVCGLRIRERHLQGSREGEDGNISLMVLKWMILKHAINHTHTHTHDVVIK